MTNQTTTTTGLQVPELGQAHKCYGFLFVFGAIGDTSQLIITSTTVKTFILTKKECKLIVIIYHPKVAYN